MRAVILGASAGALGALAAGATSAVVALGALGVAFGAACWLASLHARLGARSEAIRAGHVSPLAVEHAHLEAELVSLLTIRHPSPATRRRIAAVRAQLEVLEDLLTPGKDDDAPF